MKNIKSTFSILLMLPLLFLSCDKEDGNPETSSKFTEKSGFTGVGQQHNEALAQIYTTLLNAGPLQEEDSAELARETGMTYLNEQGINNPDYNEIFDVNRSNIPFTSATDLYSSNSLSPALRAELITLETTFDQIVDAAIEQATDETAGIIADQVFSFTQQIVNQVPQSLQTVQDRLAWQHAVEVMGYSCVYWSENMVNWLYLNPDFQPGSANRGLGSFLKKAWNFIKPTVKADAVGAAAGAVKGAIAGVGGGLAGMAAGAAAGALEGGLAASAGNAIGRLWDAIF